jgi:hypothetical protein
LIIFKINHIKYHLSQSIPSDENNYFYFISFQITTEFFPPIRYYDYWDYNIMYKLHKNHLTPNQLSQLYRIVELNYLFEAMPSNDILRNVDM